MFEGVKTPDVFAVLGHPLRRALLDRLRAGGGAELPVKHLAAPFSVSRPAVSQHLAVLLAAGLVRERKVGRERRYRLQAERLREVYEWAGSYQSSWAPGVAAVLQEQRTVKGGARSAR
jgi:DNA-binding transcriptional ArsR family regulator